MTQPPADPPVPESIVPTTTIQAGPMVMEVKVTADLTQMQPDQIRALFEGAATVAAAQGGTA